MCKSHDTQRPYIVYVCGNFKGQPVATLKVTFFWPGWKATLPLKLNSTLGASYGIFVSEDAGLFPVGDGDQLWATVVNQGGGHFMQRGGPVE